MKQESGLLRASIFQEKKALCLALPFDVYVEISKMSLDANMPIKAMLEGFCRLCVDKDVDAIKLLNKIAADLLRREVESYYAKKNPTVDTLDHDTLYNLIEKGSVVK